MRCRPVDEYGDMMPLKRKQDMWEGAQAIGQAIRSRIRMIHGEWWEDESLGFEVPVFLMDGMKENRVEMLVNYTAAYILATEGVTSMASQWHNLWNRELTMGFVVNTTDGETAEGMVTMDELLSAVSG